MPKLPLINLSLPALALFTGLLPASLPATLIEISGDINGTDGATGMFSITIDTATESIYDDSFLASMGDVLSNDWYAYDVVDALVLFDGLTFDETDILPMEGFFQTPDRDIYVDEGPASTGAGNLHVIFRDGLNFLSFGLPTTEDIVTPEGIRPDWIILATGGRYQSPLSGQQQTAYSTVVAAEVQPQPEVPEPSTMILLGTALVGQRNSRRSTGMGKVYTRPACWNKAT